MIKLKVRLDTTSARWKKAFPLMQRKIKQAVSCAFMNVKKPSAFNHRVFEISVILTDDNNVRALNKNYRGKDKPTNVLSFPQINLHKFNRTTLDIFPRQSTIPLGDIVLAFQTIRCECQEQKKSLENHVIHLIVHGTLHLMGHDHVHQKDYIIMEKLECDILASLGYPDPYHADLVKKNKC